MMVVNAVGTVLQSAYFIIFYVYTGNKVSGKWDGGRGDDGERDLDKKLHDFASIISLSFFL